MEETLNKNLPARPNLEHLRSQAKALLNALRQGDIQSAQTFIDYLPEARGMSVEEVLAADYRLADAQSVIARKTGFARWPGLTNHVEKLRNLEGVWEFVELEVDGATVPALALSQSRLLIDGDRFRMESPEAIYEGVFCIDVEAVPHRIDIEFVEGPEAGNWCYGIFEIESDQFKLCLGLVGASRPEEFATTSGSSHALETMRRVTKTRPTGVDGGQREPHSEATNMDPEEFEPGPNHMLDRLQGEWSAVELVRDGHSLPKMMLATGSRVNQGGETKVIFGGQVMVHAKVRIDDSNSPAAVDYLNVGTMNTGQLSLGIMEWIGDDVRFCMASPGAPRPSEFGSEPGSGVTLSRWRRK